MPGTSKARFGFGSAMHAALTTQNARHGFCESDRLHWLRQVHFESRREGALLIFATRVRR
jgi:hypothetical protein